MSTRRITVVALLALAVAVIASTRAFVPVSLEQAPEAIVPLDEGPLTVEAWTSDKTADPAEVTELQPWANRAPTTLGRLDRMAEEADRPLGRRIVAEPLTEYRHHGHLNFGHGWSNPLDLPTCSLTTAPDTSISYFSGMVAGDGYKLWMNPGNCSGCNPTYPFRVDSVRFSIVQDDGSPQDTVYFGIDIECADLDPADPCNGPGMERAAQIFYVVLPLDTLDTFLSVYDLTLDLDSMWVDGPFFLGIFHLGHSVTDPNIFHPNITLDAAAQPPVTPCHAWANLSGTWERWADVWVDPDPGYPIVTLHGECDAADAPALAPCPVECGQSRIGSGIAYYDPTTTAVWMYFDTSPDLQFPYKPTRMEFSLYYPTAGASDDSVTVLITYGCPRFGSVCCAPSDVLCSGQITLVRGNGSANFVLPVSLDLTQMPCCLPSAFWAGAIIAGVGDGDPVPSFLWSSVVDDPNAVPDCEQWVFSDGMYQHWPQGSMAWADMQLAGECGTCGGDPQDQCTPYVPETLNCAGATPVACNASGVTLTGQSNAGTGTVTEYCCVPWNESGPERVYSVTVPNNGNLSASLSNITGGDVDVFILSSCAPNACIAGGDESVTVSGLSGGTYYIVVDGFNGDVATYSITVACFASCHATTCDADFAAGTVGTATRYMDGEWDATMDTVYYSYYSGAGATQSILKFNPATCDTFRRLTWTSTDASLARFLVVDPRRNGQFWSSTAINATNGTGRIYRINNQGVIQNSWSTIPGLPIMRFSGAAFDPVHNHLWVFVRDSANLGVDRAYELDVTNDTATPVVIQGPHVVPNISPYTKLSTGGADYAQWVNKILVMAQGTPNDFVTCLTDVDPDYAGPPPGPGFTADSWCPPDSNALQGFGMAAVDDRGSGSLFMTNFTDGNPPHPLNWYPSPCALSNCERVINATVYWTAGSVSLYWTAPQTGHYRIFVSTVKNNDGNPDGGADPNFTEAANVVRSAGPASWTDPNSTATYKNYVIVSQCP